MFITILGSLVLLSCGVIALWLIRRDAPLDESARFRRAGDLTREWADPTPPRSGSIIGKTTQDVRDAEKEQAQGAKKVQPKITGQQQPQLENHLKTLANG